MFYEVGADRVYRYFFRTEERTVLCEKCNEQCKRVNGISSTAKWQCLPRVMRLWAKVFNSCAHIPYLQSCVEHSPS